MAEKPRILQNYKDMIWTLIPLVGLCLIIAAVAGTCSFAPDGPKGTKAPLFDATAALTEDARTLPFPVRNPELPGWQPQSGRRASVPDAGDAVQTSVGYISPSRRQLEVTQSNATQEQLFPLNERGNAIPEPETVAGLSWLTYETVADNGRHIKTWLADAGPVRYMLAGGGPDAEFVTVATALEQAKPLPAGPAK